MCSILGYSGKESAASVLVNGLRLMEYRGYDSVGVATIDADSIQVRKGIGKVTEVNKRLGLQSMSGNTGIGHTRWATHGGVTDGNAHPHTTCNNDIAVVHNGIIENYIELKNELTQQGHHFKSQTDSEVIAHLIEIEYSKRGAVKESVIEACRKLRGSYAFVAAFQDGTLAAARWEEPLIVGVSNDSYFISSDVLGFLKYTDKAIFLDIGDVVVIEDRKLNIYDFEGNTVTRPTTAIAWELGAAEKGKFTHFTLKEIHEQNHTITNTMIKNQPKLEQFCNEMLNAKHIFFTGSGSSYHVALLAKGILGKCAKIHAEVIVSSEFQYESEFVTSGSVLIAISQSGESADVLESVKKAKQTGAKVLSIVNVTSSSLARASDSFLSLDCGPEIGVAATKSFTSQLAAIYAIADHLVKKAQGQPCNSDLVDTTPLLSESGYRRIAAVVEKTLSSYQYLSEIVHKFENIHDIYLLGRSLHYPIALEGALKLKELSYIHAEGLAAGELKHGPLALMDKNSLVVVINPTDDTYQEALHNIHEIKARGATVLAISDKNNDIYDYWIQLPKIDEYLYPLIEVIPLQIISYLMAISKKVDPDYPRNLAKSVTVK
jgi:glutamine---fructose-6-phosphate transaminase (isomerizing)